VLVEPGVTLCVAKLWMEGGMEEVAEGAIGFRLIGLGEGAFSEAAVDFRND